MAPWSKVNVFLTIAMCVLYGLLGPSNADMSARAFQYGYCQCAWQSWCWQRNRDCWACAAAWSAGFAQGEAAAAAAAAAAAQRAAQQRQRRQREEAEAAAAAQRARGEVQELLAQWEADLNMAEAAAASTAASAAREQARAENQTNLMAVRKANKKSKSHRKSKIDPQTGATLSWTTR